MDVRKYAAELIGTFWLTFMGCGSAVIAAAFPQVGIGLLGVALAFGLSVVTMAYAIGHISGCHLNPAVTVGLAAGGRFPAGQVVPYVIAQVIGAVAGAALLYVIASGAAGLRRRQGIRLEWLRRALARSLRLVACFITEVIMTVDVPVRHHGIDPRQGAGGFRAARDRTCADDDSPCQHSRHQHVGESGAQHRSRTVRRRLGFGAALAVLGSAADRRHHRRRGLSRAEH